MHRDPLDGLRATVCSLAPESVALPMEGQQPKPLAERERVTVATWVKRAMPLPRLVSNLKAWADWLLPAGLVLQFPVLVAVWRWVLANPLVIMLYGASLGVAVHGLRQLGRRWRRERRGTGPPSRPPIGERWLSREDAADRLRSTPLVPYELATVESRDYAMGLLDYLRETYPEATHGDWPRAGEVNRDALLWWVRRRIIPPVYDKREPQPWEPRL